MDETYIFEKTVEDRLADYKDILQIDGRPIPASQIQREWSYHLELAIDHAGWQALWKVPKKDCEVYEITYPNVVIVYVEDVSFHMLTAQVKVIAVKNDIHLPSKLEVNLIDLYPTIEQDQSIAINISSTAENVDILRYFYNNIWMPWDHDEDETDWPSGHLESRVRLSFDLKSGVIPRSIVVKIRSLINEGKSIIDKLQMLEEDLSDCDEIDLVNPSKVYELTTLNGRLVQIRTEFELYENSQLRKVLINELKSKTESNITKDWLIFTPKSVSAHIRYLQAYDQLTKHTEPQTAVTLKNALQNACPSDRIYLDNCTYPINSLGNLECGGNIQGLFADTNIVDEENVVTLFEIFGKEVRFENLNICLDHATTGVSVKQGRVIMKNCSLKSKNKSFSRQAIVVHPGCEILLEACRLDGFNFAIVCKSTAKVKLIGCTLTHNNTGIMCYDASQISMQNCWIQECADFGICLESLEAKTEFLNLDQFNRIEGISLTDVKFKENGKGDMKIIEKKTSIKQLDSGVTPMKKGHTLKKNILSTKDDDVEMEGIAPLN